MYALMRPNNTRNIEFPGCELSEFEDCAVNTRSEIISDYMSRIQHPVYFIPDVGGDNVKSVNLPKPSNLLVFGGLIQWKEEMTAVTLHDLASANHCLNEIYTPRILQASAPYRCSHESLLQGCLTASFIAAGYELYLREWSSTIEHGVGDLVFRKDNVFIVCETKVSSGAIRQSLKYANLFQREFVPNVLPEESGKTRPNYIYGLSCSLGSALSFNFHGTHSNDAKLQQELVLLSMYSAFACRRICNYLTYLMFDNRTFLERLQTDFAQDIALSLDDVHCQYPDFDLSELDGAYCAQSQWQLADLNVPPRDSNIDLSDFIPVKRRERRKKDRVVQLFSDESQRCDEDFLSESIPLKYNGKRSTLSGHHTTGKTVKHKSTKQPQKKRSKDQIATAQSKFSFLLPKTTMGALKPLLKPVKDDTIAHVPNSLLTPTKINTPSGKVSIPNLRSKDEIAIAQAEEISLEVPHESKSKVSGGRPPLYPKFVPVEQAHGCYSVSYDKRSKANTPQGNVSTWGRSTDSEAKKREIMKQSNVFFSPPP